MHPLMNRPVNSTDPLHSMQQMAEAAALLVIARRLMGDALKLVRDEWQWHRPDDNWKLPEEIEKDAVIALERSQNFNASIHWTINTLRKQGASMRKV